MRNLKVGLPVLFDEDGLIARRYGVFELPYNFLIDKEGILKGRYLGYSESTKHEFESRLRELLSTPQGISRNPSMR
jgi:alkyl hydroperoxide reductase subunit AhpC